MLRSKEQVGKILDAWCAIKERWRQSCLNKANFAKETAYPLSVIQRGFSGEPAPLTIVFMRNCVRLFCRISARADINVSVIDTFSWDECHECLKPQPEMPPREDNPWDHEDEG